MTADDGFDVRWQGASIPEKYWHFHRRLYTRCGIIMAPGDFSDMMTGLSNGTALFLLKRKRTRDLYAWRLKSTGQFIYVLASKGVPHTVLPYSNKLRRLRRQVARIERLK